MENNDITMQKFVCQPTENGDYVVARWNEVKKEYIPIGKSFKSEDDALSLAKRLNIDYEEELKEEENTNKDERDGKTTKGC